MLGFNQQDNTPLWRTLSYGAVGSALYTAHKYQLGNSPTYAKNLYGLAKRFEDITPFHWGDTLGLSERASSYILDDIHFSREQLFSNGQLTEAGQHFQRVFGDKVNVSAVSENGFKFSRTEKGSPFLNLEGYKGVKVRFAPAGHRFAGSSFRYNRPLSDSEFTWSKKTNIGSKAWENFQSARHSQDPFKFNPLKGNAATKASVENINTNFAPWYASFESDSGLFSKAETAADNLKRSIGPQAFELFERPQRLLSEIGLGLKTGTYNKVLHVPFVGSGGLINNVLLKRVLPIAVGLTAAKWLDYKTNHVVSNSLIDIPLKLNVLRASITDKFPGARSITDWYKQEEGSLPQYGPIALPVGGVFLGGLIHMTRVVAGKYKSTDELASMTRAADSSIFPELSLLKRAWTGTTTTEALGKTWKAFGTPGKGLLIGLALMAPFVPGMLGSRKTAPELRRIYSGEEEVPIKQGRWWSPGSTPLSGTRITAWQPHQSVIMKSHAREISLYGSEEEAWKHNPLLHPLRWLKDPYFLERLHEKDRPYPITSPAFSNVPLVGPLLASTIGKLVKPPVRMHEGEWDEKDYTLYSNRLEPRGPEALAPSKPEEEFSAWHTFKREVVSMAEFIGLPGFIMRSAYNKAYPTQGKKQDVYLQGSRQMTSTARAYYERNLGEGTFLSPSGGITGYTEPLRRFIQPEGYVQQVNEIPNEMPSWLPSTDYMVNFHKGDPVSKIDMGWARLPGEGYAAIHPELKGVDPEDYPDITKLKILGDVAAYSKEYQKYAGIIRNQINDNPDLKVEYERITEQVRKTKKSTLVTTERHFSEPVDTIEGTVKQASAEGIELNEYPGRTFHFSSVGSNMSDLVAEDLGSSNTITKQAAVKNAEFKLNERDKYLSEVLASGTDVSLVVPRGAADSATNIRAVVSIQNENINREMINRGYGVFREDLGGAEEQAMHGWAGRLFGKYSEEMFFEGDQSPINPTRYLPSPFHTKLAQQRTAYGQYVQQEAIGTRMRRWDRPIHDFLIPYLHGAIAKVTGVDEVPKEVKRRRDLDTTVDMLTYLRDLQEASDNPEEAGRYTSQSKRTNIGANLYGSTGYVASTLPSREARYFRRFVEETDPEVRQNILDIVPEETRISLEAQWERQKADIQAAESQTEATHESGRPHTDEDVEEYKQSKTKLKLDDYLRSKQIANFFFTRKLHLPDEEDSQVLDPNIDYQDVKLKIVNQEGYDAHDFNIFDDRSSVLWRKPYLDGAVRELTSGDSRNQDQLRQAVEQMMIAAGNLNPDVRYTSKSARRSRANVTVNAYENNEKDVLKDMRRNREDY